MSLEPAFAQYFKDLIEGRDVPQWHPWWRAHRSEVEAALGRTDYLKLKFGGVKAAANYLTKIGVAYEWTTAGKRAHLWSQLHRDFVDEHGRPKPELRRKAYGGAIAAFEDGDSAAGEAQLVKVMRKVRRLRDDNERAGELESLQFDGEMLCDEGHPAGIPLLRAVARWTSDSDLDRAAVEFAQQKLTSLGQTW